MLISAWEHSAWESYSHLFEKLLWQYMFVWLYIYKIIQTLCNKLRGVSRKYHFEKIIIKILITKRHLLFYERAFIKYSLKYGFMVKICQHCSDICRRGKLLFYDFVLESYRQWRQPPLNTILCSHRCQSSFLQNQASSSNTSVRKCKLEALQ